MTTHDHTLFTTVPYTEIPFLDHNHDGHDLDLSLSDVFAPGMLEHWDLDLDLAGKPAGEFPVPTDFGFNYPVDLVELGCAFGEGEVGQTQEPGTTALSTLLRSTSYQATQRALYMTTSTPTPTTPTPTPTTPNEGPHYNNNNHNNNAIYSPSSPTSTHNPSDTISVSNSDTESISFGPRTPPSHSYTPTYTFNTEYSHSPNQKKRKADTGLHHNTYTYNYPEASGDREDFALGVLPEDAVFFYPTHTRPTTSASGSGHHNPKRRRSSVEAHSPYQEELDPEPQQPQPQPEQQAQAEPQPQPQPEQDIFTPLEMPDGSTRFTSNWLPVDPSGGFTICPDPLAGALGEAFVSVGG
ncbi:hypothetical protein ANOM_006144 [Aspergillus nomiae NRRL 13137]|uniref:Uncharacterized protein n=1 Tax=Aspergillus nomiae NRRL (strain ATCC 15546 / NRRL 13137 / CBS 260.88 / M93) TaxID=1509407 RepID=A0A0L1J227_ASPN3|nr:uncharacterized protein ANOM_006144 [Aspergillus nomiae NRRL 13137]KNG85809.1 hypothetical protein ANOM_006144 [Aspergillus nomiae NRRL 13137]